MTIKHVKLLTSVISISLGVLFAFQVNAEWVMTHTTSSGPLCYPNDGDCTSGGWASGNVLMQKFQLPFTTATSSIVIDKVYVGVHSTDGVAGSGASTTLNLLNVNGDSVATSSIVLDSDFGGPYQTYTIPGGYTWTEDGDPYDIPYYWRIQQFCAFDCGSKQKRLRLTEPVYGGPFYGTFSSTTPGSLPLNYPAHINDFLTYIVDRQFAFKLGANTALLSIENYQNNDWVYGTIELNGTCSQNLDLTISNGTTFGLYEEYTIQDIVCSSGEWSYNPGALTEGTWDMVASSSGQTATGSFTYFSENPYPNALPDDATGTPGWFGGYLDNLRHMRPYSYIWDIYQLLTQTTSASSSLPIAQVTIPSSTSPYLGMQFTPFDDQTFTRILPQSAWNTLRPYFQLVLYLSFVFYIWFRVKAIAKN